QRLHPGPERGCTLVLRAAAPEDGALRDAGALDQLLGSARLADAGLADQEDEPAASVARARPALLEVVQLALAADEVAAGDSGGRGHGGGRESQTAGAVSSSG